MSEDRQKYIFGKNLSNYVANSGKDQKDIAKDLGFAPTTFNTWCMGKIIPSMGKVQSIADYFGIGKTDLLDDKSKKQDNGYYINNETAEIAEKMRTNSDLKVLFDAAKDAKPEDLQATYNILLALKRKERGE